MEIVLCLWITIILCFHYVLLAPVQNGTPKLPLGDTISFMKRYGYLEEGDGQSDALYSETGISEVVKLLQKFGNITQSGVIDNDTLKLMKSPRCGVPDVIRRRRSKRFIIGGKGWNKRHISYFIANWAPSLGEHSVVKNIQLALDTWGKYGRLTFHRTQDNNADIIVAFGSGYHGDRYPFDGPGNILAHAFFPYEQDAFGGDIHFDNDEKWTDRQPDDTEDGTDFFTVAVHELGHSLGLSHSHQPTSIMFPYYRGVQNHAEFSLDYDDILGIYELYIRRYIEGDENINDEIDSSTSEEKTTTSRYTTPTTTFSTLATSTNNPVFTGSEFATVTYEDDFETVDHHKSHDTTHGIPTTNSPSFPNICQGNFDAVATLRDELFIFKDKYIWRLKDRLRIQPGYPAPLKHMFPNLPEKENIDAAYQRPDGNIILVIGKFFWVYNGKEFIEGSPRPLTDYGLPDYIDKIDAAQLWGKNGKTYFYKQDRFWRYNEHTKRMDPGYPKHMERWRGIPTDIDAVTTWKDGYTYFFKGKLFWKFDNDWVMATESSPMPSPQVWLGCPEEFTDNYHSRET